MPVSWEIRKAPGRAWDLWIDGMPGALPYIFGNHKPHIDVLSSQGAPSDEPALTGSSASSW